MEEDLVEHTGEAIKGSQRGEEMHWKQTQKRKQIRFQIKQPEGVIYMTVNRKNLNFPISQKLHLKKHHLTQRWSSKSAVLLPPSGHIEVLYHDTAFTSFRDSTGSRRKRNRLLGNRCSVS